MPAWTIAARVLAVALLSIPLSFAEDRDTVNWLLDNPQWINAEHEQLLLKAQDRFLAMYALLPEGETKTRLREELQLQFWTLANVRNSVRLRFNEEFSNNQNNWYVGSSDNYDYSIRQGNYIFRHKGKGYWIKRWLDQNIPHKLLKDNYLIDVRVRHLAGTKTFGYGFSWDFLKGSHASLHTINASGQYWLGKREFSPGKWLGTWSTNPQLVRSSGWNVISILKTAGKAHFYINDRLIGIRTEEQTAGVFALFVNDDQTIAFDAIKVYSL